jgi:hypothetical protein
MRLRYLRIKNYPPLNDIAITFDAESPLQRECAIRFVVGVNGSGKTHLLQALTYTFISLINKKPPHFPVTLIYELGQGKEFRTLIFDHGGDSGDVGWWQSEEKLRRDYREWAGLVEQVRKGSNNWEALIRGQGAWPGETVGLPRTILAYTTGDKAPWLQLFQTEPSAEGVDIGSQSLTYIVDNERPPGWTRDKEIDYQKGLGSPEARTVVSALQKEKEASIERMQEQDLCLFITPTLLKFALLAVTLPLAMEDLRKYGGAEYISQAIDKKLNNYEDKPGLRRLLSEVGWVWPVNISFVVNLQLDKWSAQDRKKILPLFQYATKVIGEPAPSTIRRLYFDLKEKTSKDANLDQPDADALAFTGQALQKFLGGSTAHPFDAFKQLLSLHTQGLINDIQIAIRKKDPEEILLFDELSDGEQVYLGRMALFHLMEGRQDALLLLDEPETHFNDKWKREIVDIIDQVLGEFSNQVVISTHSGISLTDVFTPEISLLEKGKDGFAAVKPLPEIHTFGATSDHPLRDIFGAPGTVGQRAAALLDILLIAEPNKDLVEKYWQMDSAACSDNYNSLLDEFALKVRNRHKDLYDRKRIEQILKSIKEFMKSRHGNRPITVLGAMDAIVEHVGPGYYQYDLYRSISRLKKEKSDDVA